MRHRVWLAAVLAVGGLAFLAWRIGGTGRGRSLTARAPDSARVVHRSSPGSYDLVPARETLEAAVGDAAAAVAQKLQALRTSGQEVPAAEQFLEEFREVLRVYWVGSKDDYVGFLRARGLQVPPDLMGPEAPELWETSVSAVRWAPLSSDIQIRARVRQGRTLPDPEPAAEDRREMRVRGPGQVDAARETNDTYEVVLPGLVRTLEGESVDSRWAVWFVYDPSRERWLLGEMRFYDLPAGAPVAAPPIP